MNRIIFNKRNYKIALSALFVMLFYNVSIASNELNYIIVTGQVININQGNSIEGHTIYIESEAVNNRQKGYYNTLTTDSEGYYYDTIATNKDKGSFIIYTYDDFEKSYDTTVHFRFLDRTKSLILANFAINLHYQSWKLQARFDYVQDIGENRNKFSFYDQTKSDHIISWHWDFGDGTTSTFQNPTHEYKLFGLFKVIFTVTAIVDNVVQTSVITQQLYISNKEYYHLGGHAFSEYFPIDVGYAYLYMIDSSDRYFAIDTIAFDTLGYYYFYQVPIGNYLIKVEPMLESEYYGVLLPTYYGDKLMWDEAQTILLNNTCWEYDINLSNSDGMLTGDGAISGNIEYAGLSRSTIISANGIHIYLFDDYNNLLTCHYSDEGGNFIFDLVEINTYWLYPEITGIHADKIKVELTPETPNIDNIEISIHATNISYIIPNDGDYQTDAIGILYPNPVVGILNVPLNITPDKQVSYEIYDMYGHRILSNDINIMASSGSYQIPTSSINNGTYILRTTIDKNIYDRVFIIAK